MTTRIILFLVILAMFVQAAVVYEPAFAIPLFVAWLVLAGVFQVAALLRSE